MEARERLARVVALSYCRNDIEPDSEATWALYMDDGRHCADAILKALHLTDAAALALMDDPGIGQKLSMAMTFKQEIARRPQGVTASPYKENPDDPR